MSQEQKPERESTAFPLPETLEFLQQLWRLNHALERMSSLMAEKLGITAQQRLMLRCIGKYPGITSGQLAAVLHLDPGTISAGLARLEDKGMLARKRDVRDNRRVLLQLTAEGLTRTKPSAGTIEQGVAQLLKHAGAERVETTKTVLAELSALLEKGLEAKDAARKVAATARQQTQLKPPKG